MGTQTYLSLRLHFCKSNRWNCRCCGKFYAALALRGRQYSAAIGANLPTKRVRYADAVHSDPPPGRAMGEKYQKVTIAAMF